MQVSAGSINKNYLLNYYQYREQLSSPFPPSLLPMGGLDQRSLSALVEVVAYFFFPKEGKTPITQEFKSIT